MLQKEREFQEQNFKEGVEIRRLKGLLAPWLDPYSHKFITLLYDVLKQWDIELQTMAYVGIALYIFAIYAIAIVVWSFVGDFVLLAYIAGWYFSRPHGFIFIGFILTWTINRVRKMTRRQGDLEIYQRFKGYQEPRGFDFMKIATYLQLDLLLLVGMIYLFHKFGEFKMMQPYIPYMMIFFALRIIPGPGGNSTTGIISLVTIAILVALCIPGLVGESLRTVREFSAPPQQPTMSGPELFTGDFAIRKLLGIPTGYTFWGSCRTFLTAFLMIFVSFDDLFGPGSFLRAAYATKVREPDKAMKISAGMRNSFWAFTTLIDFIKLIYFGDATGICLFMMAAYAAWLIWFHDGAGVWAGRGMFAVLTELRSDLKMQPGDGPKGNRSFYLVSVVAVVAMTYFFESRPALFMALVALLMFLHAAPNGLMMVLGLFTYNFSMVALSFKKNALVKTMNDNTIGASNDKIFAGGTEV